MNQVKVRKNDVIYPELSYKIIGILFEVWNVIGSNHKEKFYQKAATNDFTEAGLSFEEQLPAKISYKGKIVGIYYFDFLIDGKIILEIKSRDYFSKRDVDQLYAYLKAKDLKLGLLVHFTKSGVKVKRVVNIK